jgi:hypothetical protein
MNYFQPYLPPLDDAIVAAWDSQIAEAAETPLLAQALAQSAELFPRFAACYAQLRALPRGARRALQRQLARSREVAMPSAWQLKLAHSLAGAALLLALAQGAQAATIKVTTNNPVINDGDGKCSLIEAIVNANNDAATHPDCAAGSGADTIVLPKKTITLTSFYTNYHGDTGLPVITSPITIVGDGAKIIRQTTAPDFRLIAVTSTGDLTLKNVALFGGLSYGASGGGIHNRGTLTIKSSTISGNTVAGSVLRPDAYGGGIYNHSGTVTIENSSISGNSALGASTTGDSSHGFGGGIHNRGDIYNYGSLTIKNSSISGNTAVGGPGPYSSGASGGGIFNYRYGYLSMENSLVSGNTVTGNSASDRSFASAGGIWGGGEIKNSTISGNTVVSGSAPHYSNAFGGGIAFGAIENSTISGNTVVGGSATYTFIAGGGIYGSGSTIKYSTISGNTVAGRGGGIYGTASILIKNSTISGNTAVAGGGVFFNFSYLGLTIENSTISDNTASAGGGGVYNAEYGKLFLNHSLISGNKAAIGPEIDSYYGYVTPHHYNLFGNNGDAGVIGFTPNDSDIVPSVTLKKILGPLKKNGGPTKTHALVGGSPAVNAIPSANLGCTGTDQRGVARPRGPGCDIGAFEK